MGKINSLNSQELKSLMLEFLWFYSSIEGITTNKVLKEKYPLLESKVYSLLNKQDLKRKNSNEIKLYNKSHIKDNSFIFTKNNTVLLDFLRHIRNSIAHGNLALHPKNNKTIIVTDYKKNKGVIEPTCYGHLTFAKFIELLKVKDL